MENSDDKKRKEEYREKLKKIIGQNLRKERQKLGLTMKELGKLIYISEKQLSIYENGKTNNIPNTEVLLKFCNVFGCELGYLMGEKNYSLGTRFDNLVQKELGLDKNAIKALKRLKNNHAIDISCFNALDYDFESILKTQNSSSRIEILNTIIASDKLVFLLSSLSTLQDSTKSLKNADSLIHGSSTDCDTLLQTTHTHFEELQKFKLAKYEVQEIFQKIVRDFYIQ